MGHPQKRRKCSICSPRRRRLTPQRSMLGFAVSFSFLAWNGSASKLNNRNHRPLPLRLHFYRPELYIRGGSTIKPSAKQRARKKPEPISDLKKRTKRRQEEPPVAKHDGSLTISRSEDVPTVEFLLVPRKIGWTRLFQWVSVVAMFVSFLECLKTVGRPYAAAVHATIYGKDSSVYTAPSSIDQLLAQRLAQAAGDVLPPPHLPNATPLVGVLVSLAIYLAATLFPKWSLPIHVWMNHSPLNVSSDSCNELHDILQEEQVFAYVKVPRDERHLDGKTHVLCRLHTISTKSNKDSDFYFELHHKRFYYSPETKQVLDGGPTLHSSVPLQALVTAKGLVSESLLNQAKKCFSAYNTLTLPTPTVMAAFQSRISSPLAILQLVGRLLSALEEDVRSSAMSIAMTLFHHYWNARQSIVSATELSKEVGDSVENASRETVWALRPSKKSEKKHAWKRISAVELLPGDVFVMNSTATIMPVDALLLEGTCVTNEAVLTGESIPQTKTPLQVDENDCACLDMNGSHRHSVSFAGTTLLHCTNTNQGAATVGSDFSKPPTGARFLALRTGSYSSRGELVRALFARNSNHVGAISNPQSERDALRLIASLSCFAALACTSLFYGRNEIKTSVFRRVVQCTRIAVASIPSDLPLALSSVAHSCALRLRKEADVVCSDPGSLLTAAHVEIVVFDKTGTLTADTQALSKIVTPKSDNDTKKGLAEVILAGCHSLVDLEDPSTKEHHFVGDPLDLASFGYAGWTYDLTDNCYQRKKQTMDNGPVKLWQLKTFPFDANRRTSSALLLVQYADGKCRLWKTIKGSPDVISLIVDAKHEMWYQKQVQKLGAKGLRTISMAAVEVSRDNALTTSLFPGGLPDLKSPLNHDFHRIMKEARKKANCILRSEFEGFDSDRATEGQASFEMVGFACFDAAVRPSTRRIIQELKDADINVIMLTGDGADAAISVADTAGLLSRDDSVLILDLEDSSASDPKLVWKRIGKKDNNELVSEEMVTRVLESAAMGQSSLVITGKAAEFVLSSPNTIDCQHCSLLRENLHCFTIFARSSPKQKRSVVSNLKEHSGMKVLMCGDGVNDVAAMKVADVGVALLNGYGEEDSIRKDMEDERRLHELSKRRIGSNRKQRDRLAPAKDPISLAGVGDSAAASSARIKAEIDKALLDIQKRSQSRKQEGEYSFQYTFQDMRDSFSAVFRVLNDERQRKKALKKGGGAAARILAEEDKLRRELIVKADTSRALPESSQSIPASSTIKPGEASLAASFSCLRPAIDGVEGLMRVGVAAAACASSVQQTIALNCLLSCYNIATLYGDGFRYGKYLWNAELFLSSLINEAIYQSATTARPRLSHDRPEQSLFHPSSALLVCLQAVVHLMTLATGVRIANTLEAIYTVPNLHASKVRWREDNSRSSTFASLAKALAAAPRPPETNKKKRRGLNLLGRPPFHPNYATNIVFFFSIFQNAVSRIITHTGKPFYGTVLESRQLCLCIGASFLFVVAVVTETFPKANEFLELRSLPSRWHRASFLAVMMIDLVGCFAAKWAIEGVVREPEKDVSTSITGPQSAADKEEALLTEEEALNKALLLRMGIVMLGMIVHSFF